jgi:RNA polymerase sigma-70 factor (ECF subfamily)
MVRPANPSPSPRGEVMALPVQRSDADLVNGLKAGDAWARAVLLDRFGTLVERLVRRILGNERHVDIADVVHDAFVAVFSTVHTLRSPEALVSWVQSVATHTACKAIRRRRARAWLRFVAPEDLPDCSVHPPSEEAVEAHDRTYRILERFSATDRAVFALRFIDGMPLADVAAACGVSLATAKRRIARAEHRFMASALRDPVLAPWVRKGDRWTQ